MEFPGGRPGSILEGASHTVTVFDPDDEMYLDMFSWGFFRRNRFSIAVLSRPLPVWTSGPVRPLVRAGRQETVACGEVSFCGRRGSERLIPW